MTGISFNTLFVSNRIDKKFDMNIDLSVSKVLKTHCTLAKALLILPQSLWALTLLMSDCSSKFAWPIE